VACTGTLQDFVAFGDAGPETVNIPEGSKVGRWVDT
jgi:hypothetical protein